MVKIAFNGCFGGFSLSHAAIMAYAARKGFILYPMRSKRDASGRLLLGQMEPVPEDEIASTFCVSYFKEPDGADESHFWDRDIPRTDPDLIAVIEELGDEANGMCASLCIAELEPGTFYRIDEYDGNETVETRDNIDWNVA